MEILSRWYQMKSVTSNELARIGSEELQALPLYHVAAENVQNPSNYSKQDG